MFFPYHRACNSPPARAAPMAPRPAPCELAAIAARGARRQRHPHVTRRHPHVTRRHQDNLIHGRVLAELTKEVFTDLEASPCAAAAGGGGGRLRRRQHASTAGWANCLESE
mgnify:CR=1 FL=1